MLTIGLTGGIGSGKSQVASWLAAWGASVIDADVLAHGLTAAGGAAMAAIQARFGPAAVRPDGALDRPWMREHVFADPSARTDLEAILHPRIRAEMEAQAARAKGPYRVVVVPLLVESGQWRGRVDRVCVVDCDPETQVRRVMQRSGLTPEAIGRIMSAQASRADRLAVADDIIVNDGATDLAALQQRTRHMHDGWCRLSDARAVDGHFNQT
ncbi:dephospho-CoA kinase [Castellaniella sp.]|uniref:dephospho-CoA kinase n=1 Tax=Castellaniella sp. TaxID=1955812 RepID=UPI00356461A0